MRDGCGGSYLSREAGSTKLVTLCQLNLLELLVCRQEELTPFGKEADTRNNRQRGHQNWRKRAKCKPKFQFLVNDSVNSGKKPLRSLSTIVFNESYRYHWDLYTPWCFDLQNLSRNWKNRFEQSVTIVGSVLLQDHKWSLWKAWCFDEDCTCHVPYDPWGNNCFAGLNLLISCPDLIQQKTFLPSADKQER